MCKSVKMILRKYLHYVDREIYIKRRRALTAKQKLFIFGLAMGATATQAARQAGYCPKYARQAARQLLKSPHILVGIQQEIKSCINHGEAISPFWLLSRKKQKFIMRLLIHLNASRAAIEAGYSYKHARKTASRLMKDPELLRGGRDYRHYLMYRRWKNENTYFL